MFINNGGLGCEIKHIGRFRNGNLKYWCHNHFSFATSKVGSCPLHCDNHDRPEVTEEDKFVLNPFDWTGGIGIWGSLKPVYDTSALQKEYKAGIHLHTRDDKDGPKAIDFTFREIRILLNGTNLFGEQDYIELNTEVAHAYTASMVFNKHMKFLRCSHCKRPHIDADYFSVFYHKKHLCTYCGRHFRDNESGISNPVIEVQRIFSGSMENRVIELVKRELIIDQKDYPGGIQIWGSNPAIIWTAERPEEAGIHVHVYSSDGETEALEDDTYGKVVIDGLEIDQQQVRYLMVQNSLVFLKGNVVALSCPNCGVGHFDYGDYGINVHTVHKCINCNETFESVSACVSNPVVGILETLKANSQTAQK